MKKHTLVQQLLYSGLSREDYNSIRPLIRRENEVALHGFSLICAVAFGLLACAGSFMPSLQDAQTAYILASTLFFVIFAFTRAFLNKNSRMIEVLVSVFMMLVLGIGIYAAFLPASVQERTTLFLVFLFCAPLLFNVRSLVLCAILVTAEAVYLIIGTRMQSMYPVWVVNSTNTMIFTVISIMVGIYVANYRVGAVFQSLRNHRIEEVERLNQELRLSAEKQLEQHEQLRQLLEETSRQKEELQQALDNYKQADYDRRTDFLTGLHSRQDLFEVLRDILSGKRAAIKAMYMMDIDNFKKLNDHYGHTYGDECLQRIGAALIKYGAENHTEFYRYGDEEILAISFGTEKTPAVIAEELVQLIRSLEIRRDDAPLGIVTVSLGYTTNNHRYEKMIDMADAAMYSAKDFGKNQAVCYENMRK